LRVASAALGTAIRAKLPCKGNGSEDSSPDSAAHSGQQRTGLRSQGGVRWGELALGWYPLSFQDESIQLSFRHRQP